jgi:hypothetical protein
MRIEGGHAVVVGIMEDNRCHLVEKIPKSTNAAVWVRELVVLTRLRAHACGPNPRVVANMFLHDIIWTAQGPQARLPAVTCNAREFTAQVTMQRHREWLLLFRGILRAAAELQCLGIVHRDIKPANVLVTVSGHRATSVYLCDYGHSIDYNRQLAHLDYPVLPYGLCVGTLPYVPPEILTEIVRFQSTTYPIIRCRYTPYTDAWSLGVTMLSIAHLLATGNDPMQRRPTDARATYVMRAQVLLERIQNKPQWDQELYDTIRHVVDVSVTDTFLSDLLFAGLLSLDPATRLCPETAYWKLEDYLSRHSSVYSPIGFKYLQYPVFPTQIVHGGPLTLRRIRPIPNLGYEQAPWIAHRIAHFFHTYRTAVILFARAREIEATSDSIWKAVTYIIIAQYMPAVLDLRWPAECFPLVWCILEVCSFIL